MLRLSFNLVSVARIAVRIFESISEIEVLPNCSVTVTW